MQLNPRQLEVFRNVMVTGSMTVAAELLKVSQPAVSRHIRDLEATLGLRLFRREGNRVIPGSEAQRLFREVDRFYQGIEQVERVAQDLKSVRVGTLRVASISALGFTVVAEGLRRYAAARPGVLTSLDVRPSLGILELAAANQIDIGCVGIMTSEYPGVTVLQHPSVPAVCALPRAHALTRRRAIQIKDLQGQSLISLSRNSPLRMRLEVALDDHGVTCTRPVDTTHAYVACRMVAGGLGVSVVDPYTAAGWHDPAVVFRPLLPHVPFESSIVLPAHQPRSKVVDDFMQEMRDVLASALAP